jgi:PadR family transcriptional regulator PadR
VLSTLIESGNTWRHGYDLMRETGIKSGTLYPLLMRLSDQGLLEAEWRPPVPPARAPRHVYRLSGEGMAVAHALLASNASVAPREASA